MSAFSVAAKNTMLDALTADRVRLHSGAPGVDGTANQIADTLVAAVFAAAATGERVLDADVAYTELDASQAVTHFSVWTAASEIFLGSSALTGDQAANSAGEYTLKATVTKLALTDPV